VGLILLNSRTAVHPFSFEELGVHLYSMEELCYVIYEYPLLVMNDFVSVPLFDFFRKELGEERFADELEHLRSKGFTDDDILCNILRNCDSYRNQEINRYRTKLSALRNLHPAEYLKQKADSLFDLKHYGKAIPIYERVLKMPDDPVLNPAFRGKILNNEGSAYANLFLLDQAYRAYDQAYGFLKDRDILKRIYFLSLLEPVLKLKERYQSSAEGEANIEWDKEYEAICMKVKECTQLAEIESVFEHDPVIRGRLISEKVEKWKQDYRNM